MEITNTFYATDRNEWRTWLPLTLYSEKEIWLIYYKKHTGKPRVPYNDAVEEALCFGWIDSTVRRIDEARYMQKFIPRNKESNWSEWNVKRMNILITESKVLPAGLALYDHWRKSGKSTISPPKVDPGNIPVEFKDALEKNPKALDFFENMAPGYRRNYLAWINDAKKTETKIRRIEKAIEMLENGKKSLM